MKLGSLRSYNFSVSPSTLVRVAIQTLNKQPDLPGILLIDQQICVGMISRARCFEFLSRPFARELFLKTSLTDFSRQVGIQPLILSAEMRIDQAMQAALSRPTEQVYDPIVIQSLGSSYRLLDMHDLLVAQSQLLIEANHRIEKQVAFEQKLSNTLELDEVIDLTLNNLVDILHHDQAAILLYHENHFNLAARRGFSDIISDEECKTIFTRLLEKADSLKTREAALITEQLRLNDQEPGDLHSLTISWLIQPLIHTDTVHGFLLLGRRVIPGQWGNTEDMMDPTNAHCAFNSRDQAVIFSFTAAITAAIRNAQLHSQVEVLAITDWLTNLHNRRGFFERAQRQIDSSRQTSRSLCAMMIDIDHFKGVNDRFGHLIGDQIIRNVADTCRKGLREQDLLGRFGGEEFMILLPNSNLAAAMRVAERLRAGIEDIAVPTERGMVKVTASIGVAEYDPLYDSLDMLLQRADEAMYAAKLGGRNRVFFWEKSAAAGSHQAAQKLPDDSGSGPFEIQFQNQFPEFVEVIGKAYDEIIESWTQALELRDLEIEGHSRRVTDLTMLLARKMEYPEDKLDLLRRGAMLHDIGKIAIPDEILLKPGKLTSEEWEVMKKHPGYARDLLVSIQALRDSVEIPFSHHERWDGSGYPRGLKGKEIPLEARIFMVIDVWDALNSNRCYRSAWEKTEVRKYIEEQSGIQFDPDVVCAFLSLLDEMESESSLAEEQISLNEPDESPRLDPEGCILAQAAYAG